MKLKDQMLLSGLIGLISQANYADQFTNFKNVVQCNQHSCPMIQPVLGEAEILDKQAIIYQTSDKPEFMVRSSKQFSTASNKAWHQIDINEMAYTSTHSVIGFGGAFTDSAALLYKSMDPGLQKALINSYFSNQGIAYSLGRVPMASTDFSCRADNITPTPALTACSEKATPYSYEDIPGIFSLQIEDLNYKIPMIHAANKALTLSKEEPLRLYASPWSAPAWMKTNISMIHGSLNPYLQQQWADYFVKFLKSYKKHHISFWGVTVQNEPDEIDLLNKKGVQWWQTMYYTPIQEGNFVKNYLGPTLANYQKIYGNKINIIVHDDQITSIQDRLSMLNDPDVAKYINGGGIHWYLNLDFLYPNLNKAYQKLNPSNDSQRFIIGTEACEGYSFGPQLGNWSRGEAYAHDIISDFNHHVSGWTDWNLILDMQGGPNWAKNYVDAPILFDSQKQIFYKQPMYYYLGHFSKFIRPESKMLASVSKGPIPLEEISFKVPAHENLPATIVVVILNRSSFGTDYYIRDDSKIDDNRFLNMHIPAHTIQTIIYKST